MGTDKVTDHLVTVLKQAQGETGEQRLYRSGKLDGLFPGRGGVNAEAAAFALREGYLETVRTEVKGKTAIDWVRVTPRGVAFLNEHQSPVRVLEEFRAALAFARQEVPAWQADLQRQLDALAAQLTEEVRGFQKRLDALGRRVEEALRQWQEARTPPSDGVTAVVPWAVDAVSYLDRRRDAGTPGDCPLPELFATLAERHPNLSLPAFHNGLRYLRQQHVLRLLPFTPGAGELRQPEYALLEGGTLLYFAAR